MIQVLNPLCVYPGAVQRTPAIGDYVKLLILVPGWSQRSTAGAWFRVTGQCADGNYRGRGASSVLSSNAEVRFGRCHVVEIRPPDNWYDRLLAWVLRRDQAPC